MRRSLALATLGALLLGPTAACSTAAEGPTDAAAMTLPDGRPAVLLVENSTRWPHDPWQFQEMRLAGDTLTLTVQHGGGCATHHFALLVSPTFLESFPVQMHGSLAHEAHDDPCDALLTRTLRLDLTPLRHAHQRAYQARSGAIDLHVRGLPRAVEYRF